MTSKILKGGCYCGCVRYEISKEVFRKGVCHCRSCQRLTGGSSWPFLVVDNEAVLISGTLKEFTREAASGHKVKMGFCENCGSSVFGRSERWPHLRIISASSVDDPTWFFPDMHVWTQDAPGWVMLDPTVPQFFQDAVQVAGTPLKTKSILTYDAFERVDLRSGTVVKVQAFARAKKPAFKIWADFGTELGILQTSAQVTEHYTPESLMGRQIVGCVNLGEKNIAGFQSQFLLLGFADDNGAICLITANPEVPNGQKLH